MKTTATDPKSPVSPDIPTEELTSSPGLIRRLLARQIDMNLLAFVSLPTIFSLGPILMGMNKEAFATSFLASGLGPILLMSFALILNLASEGIIIGMFGNTPGKKLAGLVPVRADGSQVSTRKALQRGLHLWVEAYLMTTSAASFIPHAFQAYWLKKTGETTYDRRVGTRVMETRESGAFWFTVLWCVMLFTMILTMSLSIALMASATGGLPSAEPVH